MDQHKSSEQWFVLGTIGPTRENVVLRAIGGIPDAQTEVALFSGQLRISTVPALRASRGWSLPDFVEYSVYSPLISYRFASTLASAGATGWQIYPILVERCPDGCTLHFGLVVLGHCGPIDDSKSVKRMISGPEGPLGPVPVGVWFDPATWDGQDVFSPPGTKIVFVTQKVKDALEAAEFTGVEVVPLGDAINVSLGALGLADDS